MRRLIRFVDWRLLFSIALLILVMLVGHSYVAAVQARDDLVARQERLDRDLIVERHDAAAERAELLQGQRVLQAEAQRTSDRFGALVAWLQARGYRVPVGLISDNVDTDGDGKDDSSSVDSAADARESRGRGTTNSGPDSPSGSGGGGRGGGGGSGDGGQRQSPGHSQSGHSQGQGARHSQGAEHSGARDNGAGHSQGRRR